jgi:CBS-domain-containing membrane protein
MLPLKTYFSRMAPKGHCPERKPVKKIMWSWLGAFMGIYAIAKLGILLVGFNVTDLMFLIGSFGASAVLTYGTPLAAAVAVAFAVMGMHFTRSLHPPGGATALIAVINTKVQALGYWYVLCPVLVGALVLLVVALMVNNLSTNPKRHYPVYWY